MPEIQKELDGRYAGQKVAALAISTGDPDWYLREFKAQMNVTMPWLMMDTRLPNPYYQEQYDLWQLEEDHPTFAVLDAQGVIRYRETGLGGVAEGDINYRYAFDLIGTLLEEAKAAPAAEVGGQVDNQAPDFTLSDMSGYAYTLSNYRGTVVVLEIWNWGCSACDDPDHVFDFKRLYREYPRERVTVLSVDAFADPDLVQLEEYLTLQRIEYPVLINGLNTSYDYRVVTMPVLFIIDQDGIIQYRKQTNAFDVEAQALLDGLLAGK